MSLYQVSTFQVRCGGQVSQTKSQTRGVRQGCPLSPYLFVLVLSMIMEDVQDAYLLRFGTLPWIFSASSPLRNFL
jgi:hypothetical protein